MLVDQCIPTSKQLTERRPDLVVRVGGERKIVVACDWDRIVEQREREKQAKYGDLVADLARQWQGYKVVIVPVVIGDLGLVYNLRRQTRKGKLLNPTEIKKFAAEAQREVLCWAVKILKRTLATPE